MRRRPRNPLALSPSKGGRAGPRPLPSLTLALALALLAAACTEAAEPGVTLRRATEVATATPAAATATPAPTRAPSVTVAFVGDLMLARDVTTLMQDEGLLYPFERVLPLFEGADLLVGNLEGQFTDRGTPIDKTYTFRTPPALAEGLARPGFDAVSLANNHTYDFGREGLEDTLAALEAAGVAGYGAGMTEAEARAPAVLEAGGWRVALLSYGDIGQVRFAEGETPGIASADEAAVAEDVRRAREQADFVAVSFHWGVEYSHGVTERQRSLARAAVEAGADAVVGHHPHVLQAWERGGGAVVLYSLGNFVFDLDTEDLAVLGPGPFQSAVALVTLSPDATPAVEFRPVFIDPLGNRPRPATEREAEGILGLLQEEQPAGR